MLLGQEEDTRTFVAQIMAFEISLRRSSPFSDTAVHMVYTWYTRSRV